MTHRFTMDQMLEAFDTVGRAEPKVPKVAITA